MSDPLRIVVDLDKRQQRQLVAVADELGLPFHLVGEAAIVEFLKAHGHGTRGRLKRSARKVRRACAPSFTLSP